MHPIRNKEPRFSFPADHIFWVFGPLMIIPMGLFTRLALYIYNGSRGEGVGTAFVWLSLALGLIGIALLFLARLPLYRQGRFLSIGPGRLDRAHKRLYWCAYGFIGASIALMSIILL